MRPLIILHPKARRSSTISQLLGGWFSQESRPEIKFLYQGLKCTAQPKVGTPISVQMLSHLGSSIMQGIANVNSVEPPIAPQKQRKTVTSQMWLITTTKSSFHKSKTKLSIYMIHWPTRVSNAKGLWLEHEHKHKYMHTNENFLKDKGRCYDWNSTTTWPKDLSPKVISL